MAFKVKKAKPISLKIPIIVGVVLLVVVLGAAGATMILSSSQQQQDVEQGEQQEQEATPEEKSEQQLTQAEKSNLTEQQLKVLDSYSTPQQEMQTLLLNNRWTNNSQTDFLTFGDYSFVETREGVPTETMYYVICNVYKHDPVSTDTNRVTYTTLACLDSNDNYFTILLAYSESGEKKSYSLSSEEFSVAKTYMQVAAASELNVSIDDSLCADLPFDKNVMIAKVREFVQQGYPTTRNVSFVSTLEVDYSPEKSYVLYALLDNTAKTRICVMYNVGTGEMSIAKATNSSSSSSSSK